MKKMQVNKRNNKGITLIALIITVIVMLILAGVAINMTIGDNGIFKKTADAADISKREHAREKLSLVLTDVQMRRIKEGEPLALSEDMANEIADYKEVEDAIFIPQEEEEVIEGKIFLLEKNTINAIVDGYSFQVNEDLGVEGVKEIKREKIESENLSDWEYRIESNGTATLLTYKGNATKLVIPNYIEGYWVKQVGANVETYGMRGTIWGENITEYVADYNSYGVNVQNTITEIVVSDGIEIIGKYAFAFANELEKITFPRSVRRIEKNAIQLSTRNILQVNKLQEVNLYRNIRAVGEYFITGRDNITINIEYEESELAGTLGKWRDNYYEGKPLNTTINYGVKMD